MNEENYLYAKLKLMKLPVGRRLANMYREIYNTKCTLCGHEYDDEIHTFFECPNKLNLDLEKLIINRLSNNDLNKIKKLNFKCKKEIRYDLEKRAVINDAKISGDKLFFILQNKEDLYKKGILSNKKIKIFDRCIKE